MIARDRLRKAILLLAVFLLPAWTVSASASGEWLAFSGENDPASRTGWNIPSGT